MAFKTRVDYGTDNRQLKQFQYSETVLSGKTTFGVDDVYIPENISGNTINIDALQFIQTRGLILANPLSGITGATTVLSRDTDGVVGEVYMSGITPNSGLELISEGGQDGWRLIGRNPVDYGNIGEGAIDFTKMTVSAGTNSIGATGSYALSFGEDNHADGWASIAGGWENTVTGDGGASFGSGNLVGGYAGMGFGVQNNVDSFYGGIIGRGNYVGVWYGYAMGLDLYTSSVGVTAVGRANTQYSTNTGINSTTAPVFIVGNGTITAGQNLASVRSDALVVRLSGEITAPSLTTALIDAEATGRVLVTREYLTGATSGSTSALSGLTDTTFAITPTDGQSLTWNNSASSWSATTVAGGGATTLTGLTDTELSATTGGYVLSYNATTQKWEAVPNVGGNDYVNSASFNTTDGVLTLDRLSGGTVTVDLDNRYSLTGHTHSDYALQVDLVTHSGDTSNPHSTALSGLTDTTFAITPTDGQALVWNDSASSWSAITTAHEGYTETGTRAGSDLIVSLGDYDNSGNGHSLVLNDSTGSLNFSNAGSLASYFEVDLNNSTPYVDLYTIEAGDSSTAALYVNPNQVELSIADSTATTTAFLKLYPNGDIRLLSQVSGNYTELTFPLSPTANAIYILPVKGAGSYTLATLSDITGGGDDYVNSASFNTTDGVLTLDRLSGGTVTVDLDDRYSLTGHTHVADNDYVISGSFNTSSGVVTLTTLTGGTVNYGINGKYLDLTGGTMSNTNLVTNLNAEYFDSLDSSQFSLTGHTHPTDNTDDFLTGATFNTGSGVVTMTLQSGSTVSVGLDGKYLDLSAYTDYNDYVISGNFDTGTGDVTLTTLTGDTIVYNLDGKYLESSGFTDSNNYVTGATFNTTDGVLTLTHLTGSTVTVDLDNRYSLTGHTHPNYDYDAHTGDTNNPHNTALSALTDTNVGTPADGEVLTWDTETARWIASGATGGGGGATTLSGLTDTELSAATDGHILTYDQNTQKWIASGATAPEWQTLEYTGSTGALAITSGNTIDLGWEFVDTISGFTFGSHTNTLIVGGDIELESAVTPGFEYYFPEQTGTVALTSDLGHITGATFNTADGVITLTDLTGGTVTVDIDNRYSLTGHTHGEFLTGYLPLSGGTMTGDLSGTTVYVSGSSLSYQENLVVDSASTETIATVPIGICTAAFFDYVVSSGSTNIRAGTMMSAHDGASATYTDNSTTDLGDTTDVVLSVDVSGGNLRLLADTTSDGWIIKVLIRTI
jgi:hypothetical protein